LGPPAPHFVPIAAGFVQPTYVTSSPDDAATLYVLEQRGTIQIVRGGHTVGTFLDIRDRVLDDADDDGEHGLLGLAFAPDYAQSRLFYLDYSDLQGNTHVAEFRSDGAVADAASGRDLIVVQQPYPNHKGGQLAFDRNGLLYVGLGDGGTNPANGPTGIGDPENRAQDPGSSLGKVLRIDPRQPGAAWQAVAYGLRNPWRFSFDRATGNLWIGDVGAASFEEVDFRPAALLGSLANYGWSRYEGRSSYNPAVALAGGSLVWPTWSYAHTHLPGGLGDCGVIGGYVYRGSRVRSLRGRYVFGDLCSGSVWSFKAGPTGRASKVVALRGRVPALSSFGEDARGELYALGYASGRLYMLR
ncbi:MAG: PQQ-dependent sugar dehydrogenase, partial [Gaiellaceae bacterium]